jgi:hypothetical protein
MCFSQTLVIYRPRSRFLSRLTNKSAGSPAVAVFSGRHLIYECLQHSGEKHSECHIRLVSIGLK